MQIDWVLDYLDDIESDLSAFHRVDDWRDLEAARFFRYAVRLGAYTGVMQARILAEEQKRNPPPQHGRAGRSASRSAEPPRVVDDQVMLKRLADQGFVDRGPQQPPV